MRHLTTPLTCVSILACILLSFPSYAQRGGRSAKVSLDISKDTKAAVESTVTPTKKTSQNQIVKTASDVDIVPESDVRNESTIAVIIANENYQNDAKVDYALKDGSVFKEYCIKTLGIPESHVRLVNNATLNNIRGTLSWLKQAASALGSSSRIIFYYSGHGIPDEETRSSYILPVDGNGKDPRNTGYSLDGLYKELAACHTESTLVLMDACFSGARRDGGMLVAAKGVAIAPSETDPYGNLVVLSASHGSQTAYKYDAEGHGLFTYYLLKNLKDNKGDVSLGELSEYIIRKVTQTSIFENDKIQTPTVLTGRTVAVDWRNQKL